MQPAIQLKGVIKSFGDLQAVKGVDLQIPQGEYVALLGPNGAGKTTLIEMIEGIQIPDQGEIVLLGKTWKRDSAALHAEIGLSLQETKFIDKLRVGETARLFASFYKLPVRRVDEVLELVKLTEKKNTYVSNLSGGQRQRLALGIALLNNPKILLLDEPTTGLDPTSRREIWSILQELKQKGTTMILTTHYMEEAQVLCERILIMDKGRFIAEGSLSELISRYGDGDVIEFSVREKRVPDVEQLPGFNKLVWKDEECRGVIWVENLALAVPAFMRQIADSHLELLELECRKMTLDDLFIALTGRNFYE